MKNLFTIGEMADLFGINIRTLRYYDEIGLLKTARHAICVCIANLVKAGVPDQITACLLYTSRCV